MYIGGVTPSVSLESIFPPLSQEAIKVRPGMSTFILILSAIPSKTKPLDQSIHHEVLRLKQSILIYGVKISKALQATH